ncbi:MFS transporter [Metabacillus sp. FJAT-52054]|uniref:MFS transporter n=1 Tax=Metabacillus sediminis TaxID=3117746 RepID=A0ABZ2NDV5_9BACI
MGERAYVIGEAKLELKKNRNILKLLSGNFISFFGDQIYMIAVPLIVLALSGSPLMMGFAAAAERLPILFQPAAGILADRMDRRRLLLICDAVRCLLTGILGTLHLIGALEIWHLFFSVFVIGIFSQVYQTAQFAYIPKLVRKIDLQAVNSINSAILNTSVLMAPAIGGLVISLYNPGIGLLINSVSFFIAYLFILLIPIKSIPISQKVKHSFLNDAVEGFQFVIKTKPIFYTNMALLLSVVGTTLFVTMLIFHLKDIIGLSEWEIGLLLSFSGAGVVAGAMAAGLFKKRILNRKLLFLSSFIGGCSIFLFGLTEQFFLLLILNAVGTAAAAVMNPCIAGIRQDFTPDHLLGRVQATSRLMTWALMPLAAFMAGFLAERAGTHAVIILGSFFSLAGSVVYLKLEKENSKFPKKKRMV